MIWFLDESRARHTVESEPMPFVAPVIVSLKADELHEVLTSDQDDLLVGRRRHLEIDTGWIKNDLEYGVLSGRLLK